MMTYICLHFIQLPVILIQVCILRYCTAYIIPDIIHFTAMVRSAFDPYQSTIGGHPLGGRESREINSHNVIQSHPLQPRSQETEFSVSDQKSNSLSPLHTSTSISQNTNSEAQWSQHIAFASKQSTTNNGLIAGKYYTMSKDKHACLC